MKKSEVNQIALLFSAREYTGEEVKLEQFCGKKYLLTFHVFASCPFFHLRVNETKKLHPEWQTKALGIIQMFSSPGEAIARYAGKDKPPFTIISDPEKKLYKQYGLKTSLSGIFSWFLNVKRLLKAFKIAGLFNP